MHALQSMVHVNGMLHSRQKLSKEEVKNRNFKLNMLPVFAMLNFQEYGYRE